LKIAHYKARLALIAGFALVLFALFESTAAAQKKTRPVPLLRAHAHNDYEHARPLLDALDRGFCSVEADIWLVDGRLFVAHDLEGVRPERTLQSLYLEPLRVRVERNGGRVFSGGPSLMLLIDVKSGATNTYAALRQVLQQYTNMLTRFYPTRTETNAITVVISGNRARGLMASEEVRFAAYDGRIADLDSGAPPQFIPLISDNWVNLFTWKAGATEGPLPAEEKQKLKNLVQRTHAQGRLLRLWGAPDKPAAWAALLDAGVDLINTDDLAGLQQFLLR
jgi:Glycerophosphoryl diester phosphodiesterase family